jgi:hypothetical protein
MTPAFGRDRPLRRARRTLGLTRTKRVLISSATTSAAGRSETVRQANCTVRLRIVAAESEFAGAAPLLR